MNTYSDAERAAYKAGCLAVERRIRGTLENMPEAVLTRVALEDLWAVLGAADQSEALKRAASLEKANAELSDIAVNRQNEIGELSRRIDDLSLTLSATRAMSEHYRKERDELSSRLAGDKFNNTGKRVHKVTGYGYPGEIVSDFKTRTGKQRFVVEATGAGYEEMLHIFSPEQVTVENEEQGDKFNNKENFGNTLAEGFNHPAETVHVQMYGRAFRPDKIEECANLGIATTAQLLDELKARAEVGGYSKYRTVDPV